MTHMGISLEGGSDIAISKTPIIIYYISNTPPCLQLYYLTTPLPDVILKMSLDYDILYCKHPPIFAIENLKKQNYYCEQGGVFVIVSKAKRGYIVSGKEREQTALERMSLEEVAEFLQTKLYSELLDRAEEVQNEYWMEQHRRKHGDGVDQDYGLIGCRVEKGKWTFRVDWFRREMRYVRGKESGVKTRFVRLAISNNKLNMNKVADAPEWEKEAITRADRQFEKIRKTMEHMKRIHYSVLGVKEQLKEFDKVMVEDN